MRRSREKRAAQRKEAQGSKHPHVSLPTREDDLDNREVVGDNAGLSTTITGFWRTCACRCPQCQSRWSKRGGSHLPIVAVLALALPQNCTTSKISAHHQPNKRHQTNSNIEAADVGGTRLQSGSPKLGFSSLSGLSPETPARHHTSTRR